MQLELDQANQDLKMPPYAEPQINLSSSRRTEGQSSSVQPRIDSNRYSEPPFDPNSYLRGSQPEQASLSRGHLDTSSHQNNPFDSYISSRHNFPVSYTNFSQLPNSKVYTPVEIGQSLDYQMNQASGQHNTGLRLDLFKPIDKTYYMPRNGRQATDYQE